MAATFNISAILEKFTARDKDYRFMALNDLFNDLSSPTFKLETQHESPLTKGLLKLLEDKSGDVQALAVKCLPMIAVRVSDTLLSDILEQLFKYLVVPSAPSASSSSAASKSSTTAGGGSSADELRDLAGIGLKGIIAQYPLPNKPTATAVVLREYLPKLLKALSQDNADVDNLDITVDVLTRFGTQISAEQQDALKKSLLLYLSHQKVSIRKRAAAALSFLCAACSVPLFNSILDVLVKSITDNSIKDDIRRSHVQAITAISRTAGHRLTPYVNDLVPKLKDITVSKKCDSDSELRESCIQSFETFLVRTPKDVAAFMATIFTIAATYLKYDPNYASDEDDAMDVDGGGGDDSMDVDDEDGGGGNDGNDNDDDEGGDDADENGEYDDDDDESWKVRRASAKLLGVFTATRADLIIEYYPKLVKALVPRFKEREETVRLEVLLALSSILRQISLLKSSGDVEYNKTLTALVKSSANTIIATAAGQLKHKSVKTRQALYGIFRQLVAVVPDALCSCSAGSMKVFTNSLLYSLQERTSSAALRIEVLQLLRECLVSHPPKTFSPLLGTILTAVLSCSSDSYYRINAEFLRVVTEIIHVIRPSPSTPPPANSAPETQQAKSLSKFVIEKLQLQDIDLEVKEAAIAAAAQLVGNMADMQPDVAKVCLPILVERLKNEITRVYSVKAFAYIAASPLRSHIHLDSFLPEVLDNLTQFLRKIDRSLKQATISCINNIIQHHSASLSAALLQNLILEISATLISESDMQLTSMALQTSTLLVQLVPQTADGVRKGVVPKIQQLLQSAVLQGVALTSIVQLYRQLGSSSAEVCWSLFESLLNLTSSLTMPKSSLIVAAQCVGSLCLSTSAVGEKIVVTCLDFLESDLSNNNNNVTGTTSTAANGVKTNGPASSASSSSSVASASATATATAPESASINKDIFALHSIGEIGRNFDLSKHTKLRPILLRYFDNFSEYIKNAAAFALGNIGVGSLSFYLPLLLSDIQSSPKHQYLLLIALKETISRSASLENNSNAVQTLFVGALPLLLANCDNSEEGTRTVVAECLGKLASLKPETIFTELEKRIASAQDNVRATVVTALKYSISSSSAGSADLDNMFKNIIQQYMVLLKDQSIAVRRASLLTLTYCVHQRIGLVRGLLRELMPFVYKDARPNQDYIRVVDLGPFKHTIDDGLELRKTVFMLMHTLMENNLLALVDGADFMDNLCYGLTDVYDIKMTSHLMLFRLASVNEAMVLSCLDSKIVEPLKKTVEYKTPDNAPKQDAERNEDLIRSALRAISAISKIPQVDGCLGFVNFYKTSIQQGPLAAKLEHL